MRILLAPDSYKGSLSAREVALAMETGIQQATNEADVSMQPMADGGEGTLDAILEKSGERLSAKVRGVDGKLKTADYAVIDYGDDRSKTVVVEVAEVVGWGDDASIRTPVLQRQTTGIGDLVLDAISRGYNHFLIGLGGTSTNDCGVGLLHALGVNFLTADGTHLPPIIENMEDLVSIDIENMDQRILRCKLEAMNDVDNPLIGKTGATAVFSPQKGLLESAHEKTDRLIEKVATLLEHAFSLSVMDRPGAGAAGGLGFAFALLGAKQSVQGALTIAKIVKLEDQITNADWVITGEGRTDSQTCSGKAPAIIADLSSKYGVPVTILSGAVDVNSRPELSKIFLGGCFSIAPGPISIEDAIDSTAELASTATFELARLKFQNKIKAEN